MTSALYMGLSDYSLVYISIIITTTLLGFCYKCLMIWGRRPDV